MNGAKLFYTARLSFTFGNNKKTMKLIVMLFSLFLVGCESKMETTNLSREFYLDTFSGPNASQDVKGYDYDYIWSYVDSIHAHDHKGCELVKGDVPYIYRTSDGKYDHIFVSTTTENAFVILIVQERAIVGHHFLDLNVEYGIKK